MQLVEKIDDAGKGAWIVLMILAFVVFWPLGLAMLFFMIWSGRMGCWQHRREWKREMRERWGHGRTVLGPSSGNTAFDDYKAETLRRLEEEQKEFRSFLDRLRKAKDQAEFDQFMNDRRDSGSPSGSAGTGGQGGPFPTPAVS